MGTSPTIEIVHTDTGTMKETRLPKGGVAKTTYRVLRVHSDDASKFVVSEGMVVPWDSDRSLCDWSQHSGEFEDPYRDVLLSASSQRTCVDDRVWRVAANNLGLLAVGTAGTRGLPPVRLYDLATGSNVLDMGIELKDGAGILDMAWLNTTTFLACGYDNFTRMWDTRCKTLVRSWEEPVDGSVYCLATDKVNCLATGTSRHDRVRVWDMRCSGLLYMKYSSPDRKNQSRPMYVQHGLGQQ